MTSTVAPVKSISGTDSATSSAPGATSEGVEARFAWDLPNGAGQWSAAGIARHLLWFLFQPAAQGALPTLFAATAAQAQGLDPAGSGPISGALNWLQGTLLGTIKTLVGA